MADHTPGPWEGELMHTKAVRELVAAIGRDASRIHGMAYDLHASDMQVSSDLFAIAKHLRHLVAAVKAKEQPQTHEFLTRICGRCKSEF